MIIDYHFKTIKQKIENNFKKMKLKTTKNCIKLTPKYCGHKTVPSIMSKVAQLF